MKYTQYFSKFLSANGTPHLSQAGFRAYMNIVALESKIAGMEKCKKLNLAFPGHIDFEIQKVEAQIKLITGGRSPEEEVMVLCKI